MWGNARDFIYLRQTGQCNVKQQTGGGGGGGGGLLWFLPAGCPCRVRGYSLELLDEKSKSALFPGAGGHGYK